MKSVFLVGFMAAGKTTVGSELAGRLALPFADLDQLVASDAGATVAKIFADHGEPEFRRLEARALQQVARTTTSVIATGGGTPCHDDNLDVMRESGLVVALDADLDEMLGRVDDPSTRPLLSLSHQELDELYRSRLPIYRQAHVSVQTTDRSVGEIANSIAELVALSDVVPEGYLVDSTLVSLGDRSYPIVVANGALDSLGAMVRARVPTVTKVGIVTDDNVAPLYLQQAVQALEQSGLSVCDSIIPAGEQSKSLDTVARVAGQLIDAGLDRRSVIVALGGGVVGDLAGFIAATLFRGIACVQVPTTILAMVDSAVGGKTGVNTPSGKNLIGAFWQPKLVLADVATLSTLPVRERRAAFGELVKYGLLDSESLYALVERLAPSLTADDAEVGSEIAPLLRRCAGYKAWIVGRDEREGGQRVLLNLGHTVGHAIEASLGYSTLLHGEAVALGLLASCRVSHSLSLCDASLEKRVADTLQLTGLETDLDRFLTDDVLSRLGVDKKRTGTSVTFVTVAGVGRPTTTSLELAELVRILRQ